MIDSVQFLKLINVRHISTVQHIVNVFKKTLTFNLHITDHGRYNSWRSVNGRCDSLECH